MGELWKFSREEAEIFHETLIYGLIEVKFLE